MKRIAGRRPMYQTPEDPRRESLRLGKYVYLAILAAIVIYVLHISLGHFYVLRGEGFVYADRHTVALPFQAQVQRVAVEDGEKVEKGDLLFTYDSFWLNARMVDYGLELADLERRYQESRVLADRSERDIATTARYLDAVRDRLAGLKELQSGGLATNERYLEAREEALSTERDLAELKTTRAAAEARAEVLQKRLDALRDEISRLETVFNDGEARAPEAGVVADTQALTGDVLDEGTPVTRVFYGDRYVLGYFDPDSLVDYAAGDRVLVELPGGAFEVGRIADVRAFSAQLPNEFQPRFKPAARHRLVIVRLSDDVLAPHPLLAKVYIRKPAGLDWFLDLGSLFGGGER